ncbi:MAG: type 4a pilus biogenesis protein PilO [Hydrocarboniphaga effusa]|nr:type 4a pilus biogenesis protein PilO [Hydrocarboniphaga effusa]
MNAQEIIQQLNTLDMQNPGAWPGWVRTASAILLAIAVVAAGGWFLVKPVYEQVESERLTEESLRGEFETKQKKVAALDAYRAQLAEMEQSFGAMLKQLPSKAEVANLLNDVSQTRVAASLEEELFQPQGEIPKEFYAAIPNKVVLTGSYHEMGSYVGAIAALPRIVTIEDVEVRAIGGPPGKIASAQLRMTAQVQTYRYLDDGEIAAASAPAKGGKK